MTTRQNDVFPGVTIDETDIIPRRRHLLHEIYRPSRSVRQIVGGEGKMLHGRLEQYGRSQRIDIGRHPAAAVRFILRIVILVQRTATESILPTVFRMKGCRQALKASASQLFCEKFRFSLANTASLATKLGYIRSQPRGRVQPW